VVLAFHDWSLEVENFMVMTMIDVLQEEMEEESSEVVW
jgi:hypothetical protein